MVKKIDKIVIFFYVIFGCSFFSFPSLTRNYTSYIIVIIISLAVLGIRQYYVQKEKKNENI